MSRTAGYLGVLVIAWVAEHVAAAEPGIPPAGKELQCPRCAVVPCCCPDDYCRKPLPHLPCWPLQVRPDDYCRKPLPCAPPFLQSWCPDTYCRKPLPPTCGLIPAQFYRCAPSGGDCAATREKSREYRRARIGERTVCDRCRSG